MCFHLSLPLRDCRCKIVLFSGAILLKRGRFILALNEIRRRIHE
jgi:hypothetical protein